MMIKKADREKRGALKDMHDSLPRAAAALVLTVAVTFLGAASASAVCMPTRTGDKPASSPAMSGRHAPGHATGPGLLCE
ncbi:hypothetical protein TPA0910_45570 [Streptomyces hygroscopicus subsp. sporocinereus]|uniref:Uncharacterized protein n=1 Tax=Streptomyces hygroscopicus TaxID=1912 RepID=A0ABQ3U3D4_STRHY|nr:hypothetical protein [Streptomyces hygroscopicus]GHJ30124.1 hypothetical protein TPA0910_45570 [Streptomyces hygroscopicus]